jgi:hypothetical protein|tara:strand:+ start:22238 stop:22642 length:405 start_codon:yes stop_codon:yes gene_type:complete
MENIKVNLSDLYLSEDQQIKEDGYDQRSGYEYKLKIGDRRYLLNYDVNKNPTKMGIKVKFFPLDDKGNEIMNPSDELLAQMQNDISTKLSPKFNEYRLEFDEDEGAPEENVVAFQIPLSSFISFIANTIFKDSE